MIELTAETYFGPSFTTKGRYEELTQSFLNTTWTTKIIGKKTKPDDLLVCAEVWGG